MRGIHRTGRQGNRHNYRGPCLLAAAAVAGLTTAVGVADAASTWVGPAGTTTVPITGLWSNATNWSPAGVPAGGTTQELDFLGGSTSYVSTDDISGAFTLNSLQLNSTAGTIAAGTGNSLTFDGISPTIQQSAAGVFTISAPITFAQSTAISAVNGGEIDFGGVLTSSNALNITNSTGSGNAIVKLLKVNSIAAGTNVNIAPFATLTNTQTDGLGTLTQVNMTGGTLAVTASQRISTLTDTGTAGTIQTQPGAAVIVGSTDDQSSTYNGFINEINTSQVTGSRSNSLKGAFDHYGSGTLTLTGTNNNQLATGVVEGTIVVAGNSTVTNGVIRGPVGSDFVIIGSAGSQYETSSSALLLDNTPGRSLPNTVYFGSGAGGIANSTVGGLNTTGIDTFQGDIVLGSSNSGAFGLTGTAYFGATDGGEVDFNGNIIANHDHGHTGIIVKNLSASPTVGATVKFTGLNNNYRGGTQINPNVTLVAPLTTSTHPLGSGTVTLDGGVLALGGQQAHGVQQANIVTNSGFNQKIIVPSNGGTFSAGANATATTTSTFNATDVLYASGYKNVAGVAAPFGLDNTVSKQYVGASGLYTSEYNPDVNFQLQPYTSNTALQFQAGDFTTHTLNIATPAAYKTINILSMNNATATVTFNFADSTTETQTLVMQQYAYGNTGTVGTDGTATGAAASLYQRLAIGGVSSTNAAQEPAFKIGSINRTTEAFTGDNPGLYEDDFTLAPADQSKTLNSISFAVTNYQDNLFSANILAVSGQTYVAPTTLATQTYVNNVNVTNASPSVGTISVGGSLAAVMGNNLTISATTLSVVSPDTSGSPYSLTLGSLPDTLDALGTPPGVSLVGSTVGSGPTFNVSNSAGGGIGNLILGSLDDTNALDPFTFAAVPQTLTKVGLGTLTLTAAATDNFPSSGNFGKASLVNGITVNVNAGTLNSNNPTALGTAATINVVSNLNFGANGNTGTTPVAVTVATMNISSSGVASVQNAVTEADRTVLITTGTNNLSIAAGGTLDLNANDLIVQGGNLTTITAQLKSGFQGGSWNGSGIRSTTAGANSTHLTALGVMPSTGNPFDGQNTSSGDILVKYTYYGDANLDGKVDGSDYSLIDNAYIMDSANPTAFTGWANGDFNYDGVVNGSDYTLIDNAFNSQGAQLTSQLATPTAQLSGSSAVPEPTTLTLLGIGAVGLLGRRRRH